jgi:hypothetical protein
VSAAFVVLYSVDRRVKLRASSDKGLRFKSVHFITMDAMLAGFLR